MIARETIDKIKEATNIVEVISARISGELKKRGRLWVASSPWARDTNPSFKVNEDAQVWKCWASGKSGDVFSFIEEIYNISFYESILYVADICGIQIKDTDDGEKIEESPEQKLLNATCQEWHEKAMSNKTIMEYLTGKGIMSIKGNPTRKRNLSEEALKMLRVGLCDLPSMLYSKNGELLSNETRVGIQAGLLDTDEMFRTYPVFYGRVAVPYTDRNGVVSFTARDLLGRSPAKWLNGPSTKLYSKSTSVLGLHGNRKHIRKARSVVQVEGGFDIAAMMTAGIMNSIATVGTSVTSEQARAVVRHTRNVVHFGDGDAGGVIGAVKSIQSYAKNNVIIDVCMCPDGKDPDDLREDVDVQDYLSKNTMGAFEFLHSIYSQKQSIADKQKDLKFVLSIVGMITNPELLYATRDYVSHLFKLDTSAVFHGSISSHPPGPIEHENEKLNELRAIPDWHVLSALVSHFDKPYKGGIVGDVLADEIGLRDAGAMFDPRMETLRKSIADGKDPMEDSSSADIYAMMACESSSYDSRVLAQMSERFRRTHYSRLSVKTQEEFELIDDPTELDFLELSETLRILAGLSEPYDNNVPQ